MEFTVSVALSSLLTLLSAQSFSAMAPSVVTLRDLNVFVKFLEEHQEIADTLEVIDIKNHSMFFDGGCRANFERKTSWSLFSGPGSQAEIMFKN